MKQAFSLIELSIVLVILGLLTGGILTGQNLIRAAELRSVTTEFQAYQTAVNTFRDKYFALPGDMRNATNFWGEAAAGAACITTIGTGTQTCNGDSDGAIDDNVASTSAASSEVFRFWQHLANAGLIEGNYNGVPASANARHAVIRENVPPSKVGSAGWSIFNPGVTFGDASNFQTNYSNTLMIGAGGAVNFTVQPLFTPEEVWNIDTKMDDGLPGRGKLIAVYWDICTDATVNTQLDADYLLTDTGNVCAIYFTNAF